MQFGKSRSFAEFVLSELRRILRFAQNDKRRAQDDMIGESEGFEMIDEPNSRRTALKYLGMLAATAAGPEFLAGWLPGARAEEMHGGPDSASHQGDSAAATSTGSYTPKFFSPQRYKAVEALTELIIPTDDQPGAREARVAEYIDFLIFSAAEFEPELQKEWTAGLALLDRVNKQKYGQPFSELGAAAQHDLLQEASLPERDSAPPIPPIPSTGR
jgi:hypothetical protein